MSGLVVGWPVSTVQEIVAETLHAIVDPLVYEEAVRLIAEHHLASRDVVIVSSSGEEVVGPIGAMLQADRALGTQMTVEDGRYTGGISRYLYAEAKADAIRELAADQGYDLTRSYAYSDSITDLPMLEAVGHPYAVNPDRALRKEAAARGWPVLVFSRPVALRRRVSRPDVDARQLMAVAALAATGAALGVAWATTRRPPAAS
jgi:phosphoserine phosphatase